MGGFAPVVGLLVIVLVTMVVNRIATVALTFTGLSKEMARFQARSAFSTCGFTTSESESVVNHPVRRRIIGLLMLLGNAGLVGVISTGLLSFTGKGTYPIELRIGVLAAGLALLWIIANSRWIDDRMSQVISWALRRFTELEVHDFTNLLNLGAGYSVTELALEPGDWLVAQRLDELRLSDIGINILGIRRADGEFVGTPTGSTYLRKGDKLIVYGNRSNIIALDERRSKPEAGEAHRAMVEDRRTQWRKEADRRGEGYAVTEMVVRQKGWLAGKRLDELRLGDVGVNVLGIKRANGEYVGSPTGSTRIRGEDTLVVYGSEHDIKSLEVTRHDPNGEEKHQAMVARRRAERQEAADLSEIQHLETNEAAPPAKDGPMSA